MKGRQTEMEEYRNSYTQTSKATALDCNYLYSQSFCKYWRFL